MLDDNKAVDFTAQEDVQKSRIVAEGDASIRLAVGTEHARMCKYPGAAEHVAVANRSETNRAYAVKKLLAQRQRIDVRGRWSSSPRAYSSERRPYSCQGPNVLPAGVHWVGRPYAR